MKINNIEILIINFFVIIFSVFLLIYNYNFLFLIFICLLIFIDILHFFINNIKVRYNIMSYRKALIDVEIDNQSVLKLYLGEKKEKETRNKIYKIINSNLSKSHVVKKYNNHYLILLKYTNTNELISLVSRINDEAGKLIDSDVFSLSLRFGIQLCDENGFVSNKNRAAIACNNAKREGMNYYYIYNDEDIETLINEKKILDSLVKSLKNNDFEIYYQPKYDFKNKKIVGSEALVRLIQDGNIVPAKDFIDVAEKYGFTTYLDKYVLREVCKKINELKKDKIEFNTISVNVSRNTLCEKQMIDFYKNMLERYNVSKKDIELEVTERTENGLVSSDDKIHELSKIFNVAIDDFGIGNSSISMLFEHRIKTIKIDRQFVIDESEKGRTILNNMIRLIKDLDFDIVVEGVETVEQQEYLRSKGCNVIQGYLYSKPLTFKEYREKLTLERVG